MSIVIGPSVNRSTSKTAGYCKERVLNENMTVLRNQTPVYGSGETSFNVQNIIVFLYHIPKIVLALNHVLVLRIKCHYLTINEMFLNLITTHCILTRLMYICNQRVLKKVLTPAVFTKISAAALITFFDLSIRSLFGAALV